MRSTAVAVQPLGRETPQRCFLRLVPPEALECVCVGGVKVRVVVVIRDACVNIGAIIILKVRYYQPSLFSNAMLLVRRAIPHPSPSS